MAKKERESAVATTAQQGHLNAVLDRGTEYEGKLTFEGTVLINGNFSGEIFTKDHLIVGEHGRVSGEIETGTIQISGEVTGTVRASQKVEILGSGRFRGELQVPPQALRIEPGAVFDGTCKMEAPAQPKRPPAESGTT